MVDEMQALDDKGMWDSMPFTYYKKCYWLLLSFVVKFNLDESIARLKAPLIAESYAQTYGVDNSNTVSPLVKSTFVWLPISLVASHN